MANTIIVGGGLSGLLAALLRNSHHPNDRVILLERSASAGGLLRSFDYGADGCFDYGTHILQETGVAPLDDLLFSTLPAEDWEILSGNRRDLAGTYFNGALHAGSPYLDLRVLPDDQFRQCLADFFSNLNVTHRAAPENARDWLSQRYGPVISDQVMAPILKSVFGMRAEQLDILAVRLLSFPLGRVVLFDSSPIADLTQSSIIRDRVGWTDQRTLPPERSSGKRSLYPRQGGNQTLINGLLERLRAAGVELLTNVRLTNVHLRQGRVDKVDWIDADGDTTSAHVDQLIWSAGTPPLAQMLGIDTGGPPPHSQRRTVVCNLRIDRPLEAEDLYYYTCVDEGFGTFRVNNYANYCPSTVVDGTWAVGLEMLTDDAADDATLLTQAEHELREMQVIDDATQVVFGRCEVLGGGFPAMTTDVMTRIQVIRQSLDQFALPNLTVVGVFAEPGLFFMGEILRDVHAKLAS